MKKRHWIVIALLALALVNGIRQSLEAEGTGPTAGALEAKGRMPFTMQQFRATNKLEDGYIVMDYPLRWAGDLYYVAVCKEDQLKERRLLKSDGTLPENWDGVRNLSSEFIAMMNCAEQKPYPRGSRVKVQRCAYPRDGLIPAISSPPENSLTLIVGYDEKK